MHFGHRLQHLRERMGWSCDELARRSGLNPHYIRSIERGGRDLSLSTMAALAAGLNIPLMELLAEGQPIQLSQMAQLFGHLFEEAPPDMQQSVVGVLRSAGRVAGLSGLPGNLSAARAGASAHSEADGASQ